MTSGTWAPAVVYSVDNETGALTFDPNQFNALGVAESIELTFSYDVVDGNGGITPTTAVVTITGTNDAPVVNAAATPVLTAVAEDAGAPVGAVGTLVSALVNLNPPAGGLDNVTDADNGALTGIAITDTNDGNGTWWYSTNNGGTWTQVGAVSDASALLLAADANTRVYFQGDANFNGTVSDGITFRAWDQTSGTAGTYVSTIDEWRQLRILERDRHGKHHRQRRQRQPGRGRRPAHRLEQHGRDAAGERTARPMTPTSMASLSLTAISVVSGSLATPAHAQCQRHHHLHERRNGVERHGPQSYINYTVTDGAGGTATATITIDIRVDAAGNNVDTIDLSGAAPTRPRTSTGAGADKLTGGAAVDRLPRRHGNGDTLVGSNGNDLLSRRRRQRHADRRRRQRHTARRHWQQRLDGRRRRQRRPARLLRWHGGQFHSRWSRARPRPALPTAPAARQQRLLQNMEGVIGTILGDNADRQRRERRPPRRRWQRHAGWRRRHRRPDRFLGRHRGLTFTLANNGAGTVFNAGAAGLGTDTYSGIEGVIGTAFADTLTGSASADQLRGGGGNDVISGLAG